MRLAVILSLLMVTAQGGPTGQGTPAAAAEEAVLRQMIADNVAKANRGEPVDAVADQIDPDIMFTNVFGTVFRGRAEWLERHRFLQTGPFKDMKLKQTIRRIYFVRPDVALVLIESEVTGVKNFEPGTSITPDGTLRTLGLNVYHKQNGRWMSAAWHNMDVKPAPAGRP